MDKMKQALQLEGDERMEAMVDIKDRYLDGKLSLEEARALLKEKIGTCTPDEFAYGEQQLKGSYTDEEITHRMDDLLQLFEGILIRAENEYPVNHPLWVYLQEINALELTLQEAEQLLENKEFILNPWLGVYDKLVQWRTHLSRKQNQLYPVLERYGFDRPTKIMWTFDDKIRDTISEGKRLLDSGDTQAFLDLQRHLIDVTRDLCDKEQEVLLPTAWKLLKEEDYIVMSRGDHEIGFAIIPAPPFYGELTEELKAKAQLDPLERSSYTGSTTSYTSKNEPKEQAFMNDLAALLSKYGVAQTTKEEDPELDVATGKLSLSRINLLFKHMPVDLSYVDENELVKFYTDTKHRIFPRSANVIGREVKNCHPAKSVHIVEEIIQKFRSGEQDKAEFWINKPGLFIYVLYTAIRDEEGNFKGVMEMMQDCTHIRALEGSQTLLTWDNNRSEEGNTPEDYSKASTSTSDAPTAQDHSDNSATLEFTADTKLFPLFDLYPGLKEHMPTINPAFKMLNTPLAIMMKGKATLGMAAERGEMELADLIAKIQEFINKK